MLPPRLAAGAEAWPSATAQNRNLRFPSMQPKPRSRSSMIKRWTPPAHILFSNALFPPRCRRVFVLPRRFDNNHPPYSRRLRPWWWEASHWGGTDFFLLSSVLLTPAIIPSKSSRLVHPWPVKRLSSKPCFRCSSSFVSIRSKYASSTASA